MLEAMDSNTFLHSSFPPDISHWHLSDEYCASGQIDPAGSRDPRLVEEIRRSPPGMYKTL